MTYFIIGLIVVGGLTICLTSCNNKQKSKPDEKYISKTGDTVKVYHVEENHYQQLRNMALGVTPERLKITLPTDQTKVYGVIMDWDLGEDAATFVSFSTGDASMYLSSGTMLIGGGQHQNVSTAAKAFVNKAQEYLYKTTKTDLTPLPDKNCVRFYFMTNKGKFTAQENFTNIDNHSSLWLPLFEEGNKVISELRLIQEKK